MFPSTSSIAETKVEVNVVMPLRAFDDLDLHSGVPAPLSAHPVVMPLRAFDDAGSLPASSIAETGAKVNPWERVMALEGRIQRASGYWAARTGEEADEIASICQLRIAEVLNAKPELADRSDTYLVNAGIYAFIAECRHHYRLTHAKSIEGMGETPGSDGPGLSLQEMLAGLDEDLRPILVEIARAIDDPAMIKSTSGQINVSALARRLGRPVRSLSRQFARLQAALEPLVAAGGAA
jgi:hypothetical protein